MPSNFKKRNKWPYNKDESSYNNNNKPSICFNELEFKTEMQNVFHFGAKKVLPLRILEPFFTLHYHFDARHLFPFPFTSLTRFVPPEHHKAREVGSRWDCGGFVEIMRAEVKRWKFACVGCFASWPFYYWYIVFGLLAALCQTRAFFWLYK